MNFSFLWLYVGVNYILQVFHSFGIKIKFENVCEYIL